MHNTPSNPQAAEGMPSFMTSSKDRLDPNSKGHLESIAFANEKENDWCIYIDEGWPKNKVYGVIAGVVWKAPRPDPSVLPLAIQHLRNHYTHPSSYPAFAREAGNLLKQLNDCPLAHPFIFRFTPPVGIDRFDAYEQMVHESLLFLLGWWIPYHVGMPEGEDAIGVSFTFESVGGDHGYKTNQTQILRGILLQAARREPHRYSRWVITSARWQTKSLKDPGEFDDRKIERQGYLGYADLVGFLTMEDESPKARQLANENPIPRECFFDLSPNLVDTLEHLPMIASGYPALFLRHFADNLRSPLTRKLCEEMRIEWAERPDIHERLLDTLDAAYLKKNRHLRELARQLEVVLAITGPISASAPRRVRLIETALRLQRANHDGDPRAATIETDYQCLRQRGLDNGDADLVAHVELNRAVTASDQMEFEQALQIVARLLDEAPRLSLLSRAKAYSAMGQYQSLLGTHTDARHSFDTALHLLDLADLSEEALIAEKDQTAIYRAFNAIDAEDPEAEALVNTIIDSCGVGLNPKHQYRTHLWMRWLASRPELRELRNKTLDNLSAFDPPDHHPWQLIYLHAACFALEDGKTELAESLFQRAVAVCAAANHGATLRLIGAVIATAAWHGTGAPSYRDVAQRFIEGEDPTRRNTSLDHTIPGASHIVISLKHFLELQPPDPTQISSVLAQLGFNYR